MRVGSGVDGYGIVDAERLLDPVNEVALVVRLQAGAGRESRILGCLMAELEQAGVGLDAVDVGLSDAEHVDVGAVDDEQRHLMLRLRDGTHELVEVIIVLGILGIDGFLVPIVLFVCVHIVLAVVLVPVIRRGLLDAFGGADADAETRDGHCVVEVGELVLGRADARELADILRDVVHEARSEDQLDAVEAHPADAEHAADVGERLAVDGGDVVDEEPQARGADAAGADVVLASQRPEDQFGDILAAHMVATFR